MNYPLLCMYTCIICTLCRKDFNTWAKAEAHYITEHEDDYNKYVKSNKRRRNL